MKLCEYSELSEFIDVIFDFLYDNDIKSSVYPIKNIKKLKEFLMDCEITTPLDYCEEINAYSLDFSFNQELKEDEVYLFLFGSKNIKNQVLVDLLSKNKTGSIQVEIDINKYLSLIQEFLDKDNNLKVYLNEDEGHKLLKIDKSQIISIKDLLNFLKENKQQHNTTYIELE